MSLAELSIKRPIFISCIVFLMLVVGLICLRKLPVDLFPDVNFPIIMVKTPYLGAGPKEVETLVSRPLEDEIATLPGIKTLRSVNQEGMSTVIAEFSLDTDIKFAEQQIRDRASSIRSKLPEDAEDSVIRRMDPADQPIVVMALTADLPPGKLFDVADQEIKPKLEQVSQVGLVDIVGGRQREIRVELDREKLRRHEVSASKVSAAIAASGQDVPAGKYDAGKIEAVYRTLGEFRSLKDVSSVIVNFMGNDVPVTVADLGDVVDTLSDERSQSYVNGQPSLSILLFRQSGSNAIAVVQAVKARIEKLNAELALKPGKPRLSVVQDTSKRIDANVYDVKESIYIGIALTIVVVFLFLGSARSTLITGLALPNSLIGAFILMAVAGFTVNIMTLLALSLTVGLLIDDAIVVRENIFRHAEMGKSPEEAARDGTKEVTLAVVATTLTVIAVFGPIGFLQGVVGQFFREFGLTICFAMLISLFDALTIAPMLSAYFGGAIGHAKDHASKAVQGGNPVSRAVSRTLKAFDRFQTRLETRYEATIHWTLARPKTVLLSALGIFVLSLVVTKFVPKTFLPARDDGEMGIALTMPPGTSLRAMSEKAREIDRVIRANPEVTTSLLTVGGRNGEPNEATFFVELVGRKKRDKNTSQMKDVIRKQLAAFPETTPIVGDVDGTGGGQRPFNLIIQGTELAELEKVSTAVFDRLKGHPGLKDVDINHRPGKPEFQVKLDNRKAEELGVSTKVLGMELRTLVEGMVPTVYREDGMEYDIRVRLREDQRNLEEGFGRTYVPNINNSLIPLSAIATPERTVGPASINRQDRGRYIRISADIAPEGPGMGAVMADVRKLFENDVKLPAGMNYRFTGQAENFQELMINMLVAMGLGILFIYLVLASLYESFVTPFAIMLVLPLAACGAFFALFLTQSSLDLFSMIGCVMLLGIATKNSILLVDYTQQLMDEGMRREEAIVKAGRVRLRPILMTTIALVAGMLPVAIGLNEASKQRTSMGIAIIGGLISSTILTLVVVPAAFSYIDRFRNWALGLFARVRSGVKPGVAVGSLAVVALGASLPSASAAVRTLTVDSAVSQALAQHPSVQVAAESLAEAEALKSGAWSSILPTISANLSAQERQDAFNSQALLFGGDPYNFYDFRVGVTQPLFSGGAFTGNLSYYGKEIEIRERDLEIARRDVTQRVIENFYRILLAQKRVETFQRTVKLQGELLAKARKKAGYGTGKRLDVLQMSARLALETPKLTEARSRLVLDAAELADLLGMRENATLEVTGSLEPPAWNEIASKYQGQAFARPEISKQDLVTGQFEHERKRLMAKHWPTLGLFANWGTNSTTKSDLFDGDRSSWNYGIQLSVPIFTGLSSFGDRRALAAREKKILAADHGVRTNLAISSFQAEQDLKVGEELVVTSREALKLAESAYREAQSAYATGTANYTQLSESQRSWIEAELAFEQARYDYVLRMTRYFIAAGWPLNDLVEVLKKGKAS